MKRFSDFITEEVVPAALVQNGSIDIDKEEVRASINMALAKVTADGVVTPYIALNRIQKALAYFHIILPKKVYLDGAKGVEVHELRQFGHKMGMTNDGEFVHEVPGKYFLFMQYAMNTPMVHGGQKAWPTIGGTFRVMAKVVDQVELDRLVSMAELALAEDYMDAEAQQGKAKACAPREMMQDVTSDEKKKGNKAAVGVSQKGLDEGRMPASVIKHKQKLAGMTPEEKKKHFSGKSEEELKSMARRHGYGKDSDEYSKHVKEEQIDEISKGKAIATYRDRKSQSDAEYNDGWGSEGQLDHDDYGERSGHKAAKTLSRIHKKFGSKIAAHAKRAADIDSNGRPNRKGGSDYLAAKQSVYSKFSKPNSKKGTKERKEYMSMNKGRFAKEETQIDELKKSTVARYEKKASKQFDKIMDKATDPYLSNLSAAERKTANKRGAGLKMAADRLEEKAPPGAKFERMVKHIKKGYSKDGLTAKEKSIAYATAWKAKNKESKD